MVNENNIIILPHKIISNLKMTPIFAQKLENEATSRPTSRDPTEMLSTEEPELPGDGAGACSFAAPSGARVGDDDGAGVEPEGRTAK